MRNNYPYHRFAVSVNRKVGRAVERNYIKRALKEWFRLNRHKAAHGSENCLDLWIVVKHKFDRSHMSDINRLLTDALDRINRKR